MKANEPKEPSENEYDGLIEGRISRLEANWKLANEELGNLQQAYVVATDHQEQKRLKDLFDEKQREIAGYEEEQKTLSDKAKIKRLSGQPPKIELSYLLKQGAEHWNAWRASHANADVDLSGVVLLNSYLGRVNLGGADLNKSDLRGVDFREADLGGADLRGASLFGANFGRANLQRADFYGADLHGADLHEANLREANLPEADFCRTNLLGADLREANLCGAIFSVMSLFGTDLRGADLGRAGLGGVDLRGANLSGANLHEANLFGANFGGADLSGAIGLTQAQINQARGDRNTRLPSEIKAPVHWYSDEKINKNIN